MNKLKQMPIMLNTLNRIKDFNDIAESYKYPLLLKQEDKQIEATSIVGMFIFDLLQPLYLEYSEDEESTVLELFKSFIIEEHVDI